MARHENTNWCLPEGIPVASGKSEHAWDSIHAAILMDIRDELRALNSLFRCANFLRIPAKLDRIGRNTEKKRKQP